MFLALPSSFASAEHRDSIQHSQVSWELNSRLIRTCTSVLHNTHVFPQGFSALPSAVPPRLPIAGICTCSVSFTHELNYQDSGNSDSNGKTVTMMMTTRNLPADNLTLILPVPQAAVTCGCLRTQHCIFFTALTSYYGLLNYFFPVKSHGVGKTSINQSCTVLIQLTLQSTNCNIDARGLKTNINIHMHTLKTVLANPSFPPETCITHSHNLPMKLPFLKSPCPVGASVGPPSPQGPFFPAGSLGSNCSYAAAGSFCLHSPQKRKQSLPSKTQDFITDLNIESNDFMANGALAATQLLYSGPPDTHCAWKLLVCSKTLHSQTSHSRCLH